MGLLRYYEVTRAHFRGLNLSQNVLGYFVKFTLKFFLSIFLPVKSNKSPETPCVILTYHSCYLPALFKWSKTEAEKPSLIVRYPRRRLLALTYKILSKFFPIEIVYRFDARRIFSAGKIIALIDQDSKTRGIWAPFFGIPAKTPSSLIEFALQNNYKVYFMGFGLSKLHVNVELVEMNTNKATIVQICENFNKMLEQRITTDLSSWCWFHKRWRSTASKRLSHEEYVNLFPFTCQLH